MKRELKYTHQYYKLISILNKLEYQHEIVEFHDSIIIRLNANYISSTLVDCLKVYNYSIQLDINVICLRFYGLTN